MDPTTDINSSDVPSTNEPSLSSWGSSSELGNGTAAPGNSYSYFDDDYLYRKYLYEVELTLTITCYAVAMIVGTFGNLVVVYTIWRCRHLHTVMYTLLASLSVADLIMVLFVLPWKLVVATHLGHWIFGDFMCRFQGYVYLLSAVSSVFHLTAISIERCYAVMFPLKSRTVLTMGNAYRIVGIVWVTSAVASIPILFSVATHRSEFWDWNFLCRDNWPNKESVHAFALYVFFLVFGLPMVLITGAYGFIFRTLLTRRVPTETSKTGAIAMNQSRNKYQAGSASTRNGTAKIANGTQKLNRNASRSKEADIRQVTVMLVVVVALFAISWGPKMTLVVLQRFEVIERYDDIWYMVDTVFSLVSFLNSAINPIVYALVSASFRQSCIWALKVCCQSRKVRRRPSAMSRATTVSRAGITGNGVGSVTYVDNTSVSSACIGDRV